MKPKIDPFSRVLMALERQSEKIVFPGTSEDENETLRMLTDAISRFAQRHIDEETIDIEKSIPKSVIEEAARMGLFGISISEEYGGSGLSMKGCCQVISKLAYYDRSVGVTIGLHAGLGLRGLNHLGNKAQKDRYLPDLASGKSIACFSATETEAGSDIASVRTTAVEDGDELVINGSKAFVTNGGLANIATIIARTPGLGGSRRGHSLLLVPLDLPGISLDAEENKLGLKGSYTRGIHFEDVRIPKSQVLGTPSKGLDHLNHILTWGRTLMASGCVGLARLALERSMIQVTQRRQFKRMIVEFGMVREKIAHMSSSIHAMESLLRLVTQMEDELPDSISWESSVAKIFCSEHAWRAADEAVQLHGGSGFIEDTGVARLLRDSRITRIFEGTNEVLRFHMAAAAFMWKPETMRDSPLLSDLMGTVLPEESRDFDKLYRRLADLIEQEKKTHGLHVFKRQMAQHRVSNISIGLYTILALMVRAKGEQTKGSLSDEMLLLTRHAMHYLRKEVEAQFELHGDNSDEITSAITRAECERIGFDLQETIA